MSTRHRVVVQKSYAATYRDFHVNARLTNVSYREMDGRPSVREGQGSLGDREQVLVMALHAVDGVTCVDIEQPYSVGITIGLAFDWDDVQARVIGCLARHLEWNEEPELLYTDNIRNMPSKGN